MTGTETRVTYDDYVKNLESGVTSARQAAEKILRPLLQPHLQRNDTEYDDIVVHNSLAWRREEFVSMVIASPDAIVLDHRGQKVPSQVSDCLVVDL